MANTFHQLAFHVVFSTKDRTPTIHDQFGRRLHGYIAEIIRQNGSEAYAVGGVRDHVHIAFSMKPSESISDRVRIIKSNSSRWINEHQFTQEKFSWQTGYSVFSVSRSQLPRVVEYIRNQEHHHRNRSFFEELEELLRRHGVERELESLA